MNYELRGKNHTMCDWLGFSKEDSLYPNHVRAFTADELPRVPRRGFYHGLNGQADAVTSTADEQREEDEAASSGLALPVSIPKSWLSTGALRAAQMCSQLPAGTAAGSGSPSPPVPLYTLPTGHSMAAYQQQCTVLRCSTSNCVSTSRCSDGRSFGSAWIKPTSLPSKATLLPVTTPGSCCAALLDCVGCCSHCLSL